MTRLRLRVRNLRDHDNEIEMVWNGNGGFFRKHTDTMTGEGGRARVLTFVYYFHKTKKKFTGGQLRLYSFLAKDGRHEILDIEPATDRLVAFPSWFLHEVHPVKCDSDEFVEGRFSINCFVSAML